ncbi:hypothetical protein [Ramlibacter sp. AN1133]|uniref:hypothetical protein n=1 Tax=Ramlibacter sp. AN1133 TaxID=3133429 RepID=UPI0030C535D9
MAADTTPAPDMVDAAIEVPRRAHAGLEALHRVTTALCTTGCYEDPRGDATLALFGLLAVLDAPPFQLAAPAPGSVGDVLRRSGLTAHIRDGDVIHLAAALEFARLMRVHPAIPAPRADTWISVGERLPAPDALCDWLMPESELKHESWVLCSECMLTASVPGSATHWRPAQTLPARARRAPRPGTAAGGGSPEA